MPGRRRCVPHRSTRSPLSILGVMLFVYLSRLTSPRCLPFLQATPFGQLPFLANCLQIVSIMPSAPALVDVALDGLLSPVGPGDLPLLPALLGLE